MRHTSIFKIILTAVLLSVTSCVRELTDEVPRSIYQGDGSVVDVKLPFGSAESITVTKVLSDESERQVNDIIVLAFPVSGMDGNGNPVFDASKPVFKQYFPKSEVTDAYAQPGHYSAGSVSVNNIPTGTYIFEGVANVLSSEYANQDLYDALIGIDNWDSYLNVKARLTNKSSVDRIVPSMLMSGTYREADYAGDHETRTPVSISASGQLSGYLHLVRADARVKFVITNNIQRVKSFNLESWKVCNIPDEVNIYSKSESTPGSTSNSISFTNFTSRNLEHSFEFYIPEYVFTSKDASLDMIRKREKRNDSDSEWLHSPQNAPYVVFTGKMEMLVDDSETGETDVNRYADVRFTVHLGACDGTNEAEKAKDYKTERNTKYTYNITINGVNDVVVEAKRESGEYNHGIEGLVIDNVGGATFNFDSHYGIANIALSKNDLKKMSITLSSVLGEQHYNRDNAGHVVSSNLKLESEDFQAFRFAFEPVSSVEAYQNYPPQNFREKFVSYSETYDAGPYLEVLHNEVKQAKDTEHTFAMYDLLSMLECLPFGDGEEKYADKALIAHLDAAEASSLCRYSSRDDIPVIFTVFVNENVYYKDAHRWTEHANTIDRVLKMFTSAAISTDGKSEYIRGRYIFDQKFCQTYYSDRNDEALCVEFVNEHHHKDIKNTKGVNPGAGKSVKSGWPYVNVELMNKKWDDCSDQSTPLCNHYNAFKTLAVPNTSYAKNIPGSSDPDDYEAIYASLSRNRDLNRDGIIQSNELKWFLASMEQYIQITIGGSALVKKLFSPDDFHNWNETLDGPRGDIFSNVRFHFCGVETNSKFWAEEGYTVGNQSVANPAVNSNTWTSNPWELLCCRMLLDQSLNDNEEEHWAQFDDLYYFSNREKNVIAMDLYRSNLHRQEVVGWIDLHENSNDIANSTFTHFQYAKNDSPLIDRNPGELVLVDRMHRNAYCDQYYEAEDASDRGTWRIPNQRETAVMRYLGGISNETQPNGGAYYLSSSIWPFPSSGQRTNNGYREVIDFCTIGMNPTKSSPSGQLSQNMLRVRCVRDTDAEGNFVGSSEYGNPLAFSAGEFNCRYNGELADYTVNATMDQSLVSSVHVHIDGIAAENSGSGTITSTVSGATVRNSKVSVVWAIATTYGKTLTYRETYDLPARYWLISRYGVNNRYAGVNPESKQTFVGPNDTRNVDLIEAQYKWIITKSNGTPVNESELNTSDTYYLYNLGAEAYISDVAGSRSYMGVGGAAVPIKLQLRSGRDGYYVIRINNSTNINSNGGVDKFGTWNGVDDGSTYKLTPAVLKGAMPFYFSAEESLETVSPGYRANAVMSPEAEVTSVSIDGKAASISGSEGNYYATIVDEISDEYHIPVVWTINFKGEVITKTITYCLKPYWVLRDNDNKTRAVTVSNDLTVLRNEGLDDRALPTDCKWLLLLPGDETKTNQTPAIPTGGTYLEQTYILYNVGTRQYLGTSSNGTENANNFTMVSDISDALELKLGGNSYGSLWKADIGGHTGFFDKKTDMTLGVNSSLRHAWYFRLTGN